MPALLAQLSFADTTARALAGADTPGAALAKLEAALLHHDAIRLMAHALPRREAVWWACMCARHTAPSGLASADRFAVEAAEAWVFRSEDAVRRTAYEHAQASRFGTPEAWCAVAAFHSGASIAPAGQAAVPPPPTLAAIAVAGSVILAAVRDRPQQRVPRLLRFLASGREISGGGTGRLAAEEEA
nr:hypothetical protein [uncultured Lichenicoccus sp.]